MAVSTAQFDMRTTPTARFRPAALWAGLAFVPVFVVGFIMALSSPEETANDATWLSWYADSGHRTGVLVGGYLLVLSALLFLIFAAGLHERLRDAAELTPVSHRLVGWSAAAVSGLIMVGAIQVVGVAGNLTFGSTPLPNNADVLRQNIGFPFIAVAAAFSAALFIAAVATAAKQVRLFRSWLIALSYVLAVVLLFGVIFFPLVALPLWVLITSIAMLVGGSGGSAPRRETTGSAPRSEPA